MRTAPVGTKFIRNKEYHLETHSTILSRKVEERRCCGNLRYVRNKKMLCIIFKFPEIDEYYNLGENKNKYLQDLSLCNQLYDALCKRLCDDTLN